MERAKIFSGVRVDFSFWLGRVGLVVVLALITTGCGVHYYNPRTGVEHLWGIGHLRMRVVPPTNGVAAVIKGYEVIGVKLGGSQEDYGFTAGYDSRRLILINPTNAAFSLEWPDASFFNVRVGTNFPSSLETKPKNTK